MKEVHVISENDLQHIKKAGRRIRATCPIHHSRDRDLSIAPYSPDGYLDEDEENLVGFGYCHSANCGATVLVQEWNPKAASRILGRPVQTATPRVSLSADEMEHAEEWQRRELAALNKIYAHASSQLRHVRAYAYLAQRGLAGQDALHLLESLGVAYIPPAKEWKSPPPYELQKWCDRIIFPFNCSTGERGYIGRALTLWQPGMDENEHKRLLNEHDELMEQEHGKDASRYQIRRWRKTYRSGFFNAATMKDHNHLYICEGPFDAIPLLLAGLVGVVAIAGTHIDIKSIPTNVFDVTLAFDADMQGRAAIDKTTDLLGGAGITPLFLVPPGDGLGKDWSERYRLHGLDGLAVLIEADRIKQRSAEMAPDTADYARCHQPQSNEIDILALAPDVCGDCGVSIEDVAREFFYWPTSDTSALCYCSLCREMDTGERRKPEELPGLIELGDKNARYSQFMSTVERLRVSVPGGCTVRIDPAGFTIADRVKQMIAEEEAAYRRELMENRDRAIRRAAEREVLGVSG